MNCPYCNTSNDKNAKYCVNCGAELVNIEKATDFEELPPAKPNYDSYDNHDNINNNVHANNGLKSWQIALMVCGAIFLAIIICCCSCCASGSFNPDKRQYIEELPEVFKAKINTQNFLENI